MSSANLIFLSLSFTLQTIYTQKCSNGLTNPPTITWTPSPTSPTTLTTTLTFDASTKTWLDGSISFTTRLFNDLLPAPTLRIQRGHTYEILFINNLGPERPENAELTGNQERDPNTTNLHTHGLHIGGLTPADNVFHKITPGSNITYTYNIPCTHSGGIHWYHPHHHPSVQLHVAGGAAGAIIVEDDPIHEALPDWYTDMRELIFFINHIDSKFIRTGYPKRTAEQSANQEVLLLTPRSQDVYIVNGLYQPTICQSYGEWIRYRFAQTEIRDPQKYQIGNEGDCTLELLARDGVIINNPPRSVGNIVWLAESSRADVAITCNVGIHDITVLRTDGDIVIAYIDVDDGDIDPISLTSFEPIRPSYLRDISNDVVDNALKMEIRFNGIVLNGGDLLEFDGEKLYFDGIEPIGINTVNEWRLVPDNFGVSHPLHIHINHFQLVNGLRSGESIASFQSHLTAPDGWMEVGDYFDTLWGPGTVRFVPDIWAGPLVVHCHRLEHEVGGAMGAILIDSGCDYEYKDYNIVGSCTFDPDSCFTSEPTMEPTYNPTMHPTMDPTMEPTLQPIHSTDAPVATPTLEPTYVPTINPTIEPTNHPTMKPTSNPTLDPTVEPTVNPTMMPSTYPTATPLASTVFTTRLIATNYPTNGPTMNPSSNPTNNPTIHPTSDPTSVPTVYPTNNPTNNPTYYPTFIPTAEPTSVPTNNPTDNPTYIVTDNATQTIHQTVSPTSDLITTNIDTRTIASNVTNMLLPQTTEDSIVYILEETELLTQSSSYSVIRSGLIYGIMGVTLISVLFIIGCVVCNRYRVNAIKKDTNDTADTGSAIDSSTFNVTITTESPSTGPIFAIMNDSMQPIEETEEDPSTLIPIAPTAFKEWKKAYDRKQSDSSSTSSSTSSSSTSSSSTSSTSSSTSSSSSSSSTSSDTSIVNDKGENVESDDEIP